MRFILETRAVVELAALNRLRRAVVRLTRTVRRSRSHSPLGDDYYGGAAAF